jgi:hypothetical protein
MLSDKKVRLQEDPFPFFRESSNSADQADALFNGFPYFFQVIGIAFHDSDFGHSVSRIKVLSENLPRQAPDREAKISRLSNKTDPGVVLNLK